MDARFLILRRVHQLLLNSRAVFCCFLFHLFQNHNESQHVLLMFSEHISHLQHSRPDWSIQDQTCENEQTAEQSLIPNHPFHSSKAIGAVMIFST